MVILKQWQICYQAVSGQLDLIPGHKLCLPRTRASCKSRKAAVGNDFSASFHRLGSPGTASGFWWWPSWPWKSCHGRFWTQFASSLAEVLHFVLLSCFPVHRDIEFVFWNWLCLFNFLFEYFVHYCYLWEKREYLNAQTYRTLFFNFQEKKNLKHFSSLEFWFNFPWETIWAFLWWKIVY